MYTASLGVPSTYVVIKDWVSILCTYVAVCIHQLSYVSDVFIFHIFYDVSTEKLVHTKYFKT
jgi:hypothetical protein